MRQKRTISDHYDEHLTGRRTRRRGFWRDNEEWQFQGDINATSSDSVQDGQLHRGEEAIHEPPTPPSHPSSIEQDDTSVRQPPTPSLQPLSSNHQEDRIQEITDRTQEATVDEEESEYVHDVIDLQELEGNENATPILDTHNVLDFEVLLPGYNCDESVAQRNITEAESLQFLVDDELKEKIGDMKSFCSKTLSEIKRNLNRVTLTGLILLHGTIPVSCKQYQFISSLVEKFTSTLKQYLKPDIEDKVLKFMCGLTKVRSKVFPFIINRLVPQTSIISTTADRTSLKPAEEWISVSPGEDALIPLANMAEMESNEGETPADVEGERVDGEHDNVEREQVDVERCPTASQNAQGSGKSRSSLHKKNCLVAKPSEWAKFDIADPSFLTVIKKQSDNLSTWNSSGNKNPRSFSTSPIVKDPFSVTGRDRCLWVLCSSTKLIVRSRIGDNLQIRSSLPSSGNSLTTILQDAGWDIQSNLSNFRGRLSAIWNAGSKVAENHDTPTGSGGSPSKINSISCPHESEIDRKLHCVLNYLNTHLVSPSTMASLSKRSRRGRNKNGGNRETGTLRHKQAQLLLPGDTCSILEHTGTNISTNSQIVAVLVDRFLRGRQWPSCKFVMWFQVRSTDEDDYELDKLIFITPSTDHPQLLSRSREEHQCEKVNSNIMGKLADGTNFYVYRFILYSDDFGPRSTIFPRGSVGGIYMKPADIPVGMLRSPRCIHPVSLSPTGINSNFVIKNLVYDIVEAAINGINSVDSDGIPCKIFLHLLGYVGDYPESSDVIDVMKHSARAPCTLCNFRYKKTNSGPSYCYTTSSTSMNSSFTRGWFRTQSLRGSSLTEKQLVYLGMNNGTIAEATKEERGQWVLVLIANAFTEQLRANKETASTSEGTPVVHCHFDPYSQNMVAPDHCISGIGKALLRVCFSELTPANRTKLDQYLVVTIMKMGVTGQSNLYNHSAKSVNSVPMSTLFALLSVLPHVIRATGLEDNLKCKSLINSFSRLVSLLYWWPTAREDTEEDFKYVHHSTKYYDDLVELLEDFINELHKYRTEDEGKAAIVDTPNVHRLIELVINTVPTYGHCVLIAELPFEAFHQFLKANISKNTNRNAHMTAMKCVLLSDWFRRITSEVLDEDEDSNDGSTAYVNLARRIIPHAALLFNRFSSSETLLAFQKAVLTHIDNEIKGTISSHLLHHYQSLFRLTYDDMNSFWGPVSRKQSGSIAFKNIVAVEERGRELLKEVGSGLLQSQTPAVCIVKQIDTLQLIRSSGSRVSKHKPAKTKSHHFITGGDAVRILCRAGTEGNVIVESISSTQRSSINHTAAFFIVVSLVRMSCGDIWAVAIRLHSVDSECQFQFHLSQEHVQVLKVTNTMSKCAAFHNCNKGRGCQLKAQRKQIVHSMDFNSIIEIFVLSGSSGFPCRSA